MAPPSAPLPAALLLPEIKVITAENARHLEKRFAFLWSSAHTLLPTSPTLANHMIASMMQLARSSRAQLTQTVLDFICERCGGLLVPSMSANVRVVPQSRQSRANRRLARQQRCAQLQSGSNGPRLVRETLSTVMRVTCHRCQHANDRPGASKVHKPKNKKRAREEQDTKIVAATTAKKSKIGNATLAGEVAMIPTFIVNERTTGPSSVTAPAPSPPRKLLDGPKRKKKTTQSVVQSTLSSFLQGLKSR